MEDRLSSGTGGMPQTWPVQSYPESAWAQQECSCYIVTDVVPSDEGCGPQLM
jgi:hypothetical protein